MGGPEVRVLLLPWPGDPREGGGIQQAPRPLPCSLSGAREDMAPEVCAAAGGPPGVGSGGGGGSVAPQRRPGAQAAPGCRLGSAVGGEAFPRNLAAARLAAFGPSTAGGSVSLEGPPSLGGATWGRRGLLKSGEETGGPAGWT